MRGVRFQATSIPCYVFNARNVEFDGFGLVFVFKQSTQPRGSPYPLGGTSFGSSFQGNPSFFVPLARVAGPRGRERPAETVWYFIEFDRSHRRFVGLFPRGWLDSWRNKQFCQTLDLVKLRGQQHFRPERAVAASSAELLDAGELACLQNPMYSDSATSQAFGVHKA